jgi:hypothetical protein
MSLHLYGSIFVALTMFAGCATGLTEFQMTDGSVISGEALKIKDGIIHIRPDMTHLSSRERRKAKNRNKVVKIPRESVAGVEYDNISGGARISTVTGAVLTGLGIALILGVGGSGGDIGAFVGGVLGGGVTAVGAPMLLFGGLAWGKGAALESRQRDILEVEAKGAGLFQEPVRPQSYRLTLRF